ncbi:hypothetical protein DDE19_21470 [Micromonospora ureilytica]|uniref:Uncharacterized protein n=1 Tax=Micromonospora ureilytica TaxID=709868 RepID=A0A3N9XPW2_9ACTN|nr:DUF6220 domain-containing protein [Micromonospora ureilytica]RQX15004.1 hypothetical protein DDE19_21470 [Micromonospora ureilytica]
MRKAFVIVSVLSLVAFALQFVFAAVGGFTRPTGDDAYALHSVNGMAVIPVLTVLTAVFAALAKAPGRLIGLAILPIGLVVLQPLIAMLAEAFTDASGVSTPLGLTIGGLHALNGIIAVHVVVGVLRGARQLAVPVPAGAARLVTREGEPA